MFVTLITQAIRFGVVFLYGSTGETIVEKSGHLNLGIPGIMCMGAIGGCMGANISTKAGSKQFSLLAPHISGPTRLCKTWHYILLQYFIQNL